MAPEEGHIKIGNCQKVGNFPSICFPNHNLLEGADSGKILGHRGGEELSTPSHVLLPELLKTVQTLPCSVSGGNPQF
jgi:hypothetical protein